jgi:hypothetical protein
VADTIPLSLSITAGGGLFGSHQARWDGDRLVYDRLGPGFHRDEQVELWPRAADWEAFWAELDRLGAWSWGGNYGPGGDGDLEWSVRAAVGDRRLHASGAPGGERAAPPALRELWAAVGRLVEGREFGA